MAANSQPLAEQPSLPAIVLCIASWIWWSNLTVLFNKWILDPSRFPYPVTLTCWHLAFATVATQVLARTTTLLDGRHKMEMTTSLYLRKVAPIGILFSGSLASSNLVYGYLSIPFAQMLKAGGPVITLVVSWLWGVEKPSWSAFVKISTITIGVAMAALGEIQFSIVGTMFQIAALVFDANRLVMIQILLSDGRKMDPLVSLYYFAPVCALMNALIALLVELPTLERDLVWGSAVALMLNAAVAFMLSISIVILIGKTSSLVLSLVSIPKNILLVTFSMAIWNSPISTIQLAGYAIATIALLVYSIGWDTMRSTCEALPRRISGVGEWWNGLEGAATVDSAAQRLLVGEKNDIEMEPENGKVLYIDNSKEDMDIEKGVD